MLLIEPSPVTHAGAPAWATGEYVEYGSVEYWFAIGEAVSAGPDKPLAVDVVQRDDFEVPDDPASAVRSPAHVSVSGHQLEPAQARLLARLLTFAADVIESCEPA